MVPGFGHDRGRFQEHSEIAQTRVHLDEELRRDPESLSGVPVVLLDAPLGVQAVAAHVPLADGAVRARKGVRPAHDGDHQLAGSKAASVRGLYHLTQ
jgi:hypothetical protein